MYVYLLFFKVGYYPPLLYEFMKSISIFIKKPIAPYNEILDQKHDFSHPIFNY
jgi:hypothetical protein